MGDGGGEVSVSSSEHRSRRTRELSSRRCCGYRKKQSQSVFDKASILTLADLAPLSAAR